MKRRILAHMSLVAQDLTENKTLVDLLKKYMLCFTNYLSLYFKPTATKF